MAAQSALQVEKLTERSLAGLRVQAVSDLRPKVNIMVYGDSGVGKTTFAGSCIEIEEFQPLLFVDVEGGTLSIREKYPEVDTVRVKSFSDMQKIYDELYRGQSSYRTVVLDSLSEMQKFSMDGIMQETVKENPDRDPEVPGLREWGKNSEQIRRMVRAFRDLPLNTIFTCLAKTDKDQRGKTITRPMLPGKLGSEITGFLDIVLYMYMKQVDEKNERMLLTSSTDTTIAKDRTTKLPPVITAPTMKQLYTLMTTGATNES